MAEDPIQTDADKEIQALYNRSGWNLSDEEMTTHIDALPAVKKQKERERAESYVRIVKQAFEAVNSSGGEALNQTLIRDTQKKEGDKIDLDEQITGLVPERTTIVTTLQRADFGLLVGAVASEHARQRAIPWDDWVRIPRKSEGRGEKSLRDEHYDHYDKIRHHESQHAAAYAGKITDPKTGEPVDDEVGIVFGFQILKKVDGNIDTVPFTTIRGQIKLRDLIEATAAPDTLSVSDDRILESQEKRLKKAGIMLSGESIFNSEDRQKMYERNKKTESEKTS